MAGIYDMATAIRQPDAGNLAQGLQIGQQFAQNRRQNQARNALARLQQGDTSAMAELQQADPDAAMKWGEFQQAEDERRQMASFFKPATAATNVVGVNSLSALANGQPAQPASFDAAGAMQFLASRGDKGALESLVTLQNPKRANAFGSIIWKNGQPYQLTDTPGVLAPLGEGFDAPTQTINLDDRVVVAPKNGGGGPIATYNKGISAEAAYSQNQQNQRLERGAELDVEVAAGKRRAEAAADREKDVAEQLRGADEAIADLTTLEGALSRLPSPAALKIEAAKGFFGRGDPGVQEALGQASVISGRMLKYVERLPGAATDKDREVFMASAGVLTNEDLPVERRAAAARAAKEAYGRLIKKYGQGNSGQPAQPSQQPTQQGIGKAALWLKSRNIKTQDDARKAVQELTRRGWTRQQIEQALDQAGL